MPATGRPFDWSYPWWGYIVMVVGACISMLLSVTILVIIYQIVSCMCHKLGFMNVAELREANYAEERSTAQDTGSEATGNVITTVPEARRITYRKQLSPSERLALVAEENLSNGNNSSTPNARIAGSQYRQSCSFNVATDNPPRKEGHPFSRQRLKASALSLPPDDLLELPTYEEATLHLLPFKG